MIREKPGVDEPYVADTLYELSARNAGKTEEAEEGIDRRP